jgi:hypothetical protein
MSQDLNLNSIAFQNQLRSKPLRENFTDIQTQFNLLRSEVNATIASTASEVTSARDGFTTLSENINARSIFNNGIATGGEVTAQGTPDNTVHINTGSGICPNGIGVEWVGADSNTIGVALKPRYNVAVINSDDTLSIELGGTADDPVLPTISTTQRPLASWLQGTSGTVTVSNSDIKDARQQGCMYKNKWYWKIQDAVDSVTSTIGGEIYIGAGNYYEDVDLSGLSNIALIFDNHANLYRPSDSNYAIQCINTVGSTQTNVKILGGNLYGNSKQGNKELMKIEYTDNFFLDNILFDGNTSSTATDKNLSINQCNNCIIGKIMPLNSTGTIDFATVNVANSTQIRSVFSNFVQEDFTANGTFSVPYDVTKVYVSMVGGGGAGFGDNPSGGFPAGGGSGSVAYQCALDVTAGNDMAVVVGAGGAGSTSGTGADGQSSSFGVISATGGKAAEGSTGGNGGAWNIEALWRRNGRIGGSDNGNGQNQIGFYGADFTGGAGATASGGGAAGLFGNGADGVGALRQDGNDADNNTGAGGSGAGESATGNLYRGGNGGSGRVIIEYTTSLLDI